MMRGKAMRSVCRVLHALDVDLSRMKALEFFAGEGDWQATAYSDKVASLEAWEIDPIHKEALERNLPNATVRIGDSYKMTGGKYDFIVFDNPQGIYNGHCEHFDALLLLPKLLSFGVVIFNINKNPYDIDKQPEWKKKRKEYYGEGQPDIVFYTDVFHCLGYSTKFAFEQKRNGFLSYLIFGLNENSNTSA